jgi:hypothetical protein
MVRIHLPPAASRANSQSLDANWIRSLKRYLVQVILAMRDGPASTARAIFRRYAELGSVRLLPEELEAR